MNLTTENKQRIDDMTYDQLLFHWRFAPLGDQWLTGQTGEYWKDRMFELRSQPNGDIIHTNASKTIGWDKIGWEKKY